MIRDALTWLAGTPWSIALHESLYVWPLLESTHVLTLMLFAGTAIMLDLRLLGVANPGVPISEFTERLLPWTRGGFGMMVVTGALLFYATPVTYYESLFFRIKVIFLSIAALNIWYFHYRTERRLTVADQTGTPPRAARAAAILSLVAWSGVIIAGRLVAYNWFACDLQPQPALVNWFSGCVLPPVT
jgi:hypothetical protein